MALILASASPRRQELLRNAGIEVTVHPANLPEDILLGESPEAYVRRLACAKARAIFETHAQDQVLGADTIVVVDTSILGKPIDALDACRMLRLLAGREHRVTTGVCGAAFCASAGETPASMPARKTVLNKLIFIGRDPVSTDFMSVGRIRLAEVVPRIHHRKAAVGLDRNLDPVRRRMRG